MKISIDPVMSARIKKAWESLSPGQQSRVAPLLVKAHQHAVTASQTGEAPPPDPTVGHHFALTYSALTDDRDGVVGNLEAGIVVAVDGEGAIVGTGKYQDLDPGWGEAGAEWLEHLVTGKHSFVGDATAAPISMPNSVRIAIAGDWGTGDWRTAANPAPSTDVARHIQFLRPDYTIHLGDVYYAGTSDEEKHLLVELWPSGSRGALTLNSNHEMYSGGDAYFEKALASPTFSVQQQRSFFALENDDWIIVGLDSAYYADAEHLYSDGSLFEDGGAQLQMEFLKKQVAKDKKVIVLTHHNGLSLDGSSVTKLWSQVMSAFPDGAGPVYWYWGHVHAGAVHKPQGPGNVLCRCCGHGGIPWARASQLENNPKVAWFENRPAKDPDMPQRVLNGFAVLGLDGPNISEEFYDENGCVAWHS